MKTKKQIKDCTIAELMEHFHIKGHAELVVREKGFGVFVNNTIIQFGLNDSLNIEVEENAKN